MNLSHAGLKNYSCTLLQLIGVHLRTSTSKKSSAPSCFHLPDITVTDRNIFKHLHFRNNKNYAKLVQFSEFPPHGENRGSAIAFL